MKVDDRLSKTDVLVGDIIRFKDVPCMVIDLGTFSDYFGILALEGSDAGTVIAQHGGLHEIDDDIRTQTLLLKKKDILITNLGEGL